MASVRAVNQMKKSSNSATHLCFSKQVAERGLVSSDCHVFKRPMEVFVKVLSHPGHLEERLKQKRLDLIFKVKTFRLSSKRLFQFSELSRCL